MSVTVFTKSSPTGKSAVSIAALLSLILAISLVSLLGVPAAAAPGDIAACSTDAAGTWRSTPTPQTLSRTTQTASPTYSERTFSRKRLCAARPTHRAVRQRAVSYTHLRAHETRHDLVCRLLLEK